MADHFVHPQNKKVSVAPLSCDEGLETLAKRLGLKIGSVVQSNEADKRFLGRIQRIDARGVHIRGKTYHPDWLEPIPE